MPLISRSEARAALSRFINAGSRLHGVQVRLRAWLYGLLYSRELRRLRYEGACVERVRSLLSMRLGCLLLCAAILSSPYLIAGAQPYSDVVRKVLQPFEDLVAVFVALAFGAGVLGFVILLVDALVSWVTGGSFGRSLAISKLMRAVETLAAVPLAFFVVNVLKELGVQEVQEVAEIANAMLLRGWHLVLSILRGP